jgi:SapC protein
MLNNITHKDLRVINRYGAEFGDNVGTVLTVPTEYEEIQREYPIFFRKDPATGEYQSIVLLGFSKDENLFLDGDRWDASYVPGIIARGPFLIGFQRQESDGETRDAPVIHVDLDHPRVSQTDGLPIFKPQGGNSPYLDRVASILNGIREGLEISKAMFAAYAELDLIEPVKVEVKTNAEETYSLLGLHTLNREKLAALDGASLERLNKAGFLRGAYLVIASVGNVRRLMERKERKRAKLETPA